MLDESDGWIRDWKEMQIWRKSVDSKLLQLDIGHMSLSERLNENTGLTKEVKAVVDDLHADLGEVAAIIKSGKGFFSFGRFAMKVLKFFILPLVLAYLSIYALVHHGAIPEWAHNLIHFWKEID
jgi:hypothetical protein